MMAFEYWHSWVKINDHPWLYLNKLWFWCLHSDCMECSGITTHSDICYSLILWNSLTCIDIYKMQWCSLTPLYIYDTLLHHLYLYLTDIYSDLISHFDTLLDLIKFRHFDTRWHNITFQQDNWHFCDLFEQIIMTMIHFDTHSTMILSKSALHYYALWNDRSL